jgi:hypothetical protein
MKQKDLLYISIALIIILGAMIVIWKKLSYFVSPESAMPLKFQSTIAKKKTTRPVIYDIKEVKAEMPTVAPVKVHSLKDVYEKFPSSDVGTDMTDAWSKLDPVYKKQFSEDMDKEISKLNEALKANPKDKSIEHRLFVAENLKKLAANNFSYEIGRQPLKVKESTSKVKK